MFDDIYPDSDEDRDDEKSEEEDEDAEDEAKVNNALDDVLEKIQALSDEQSRANEAVFSAQSRLKILDAYANSLDKKESVDIEASVETYRKEREKVFQDHLAGTIRERDLAKEIAKLRLEQARLQRLVVKEKLKATRTKAKAKRAKSRLREKERRRDDERRKEKTRIRKELKHFWPHSCFSVRISLEAASFTPSSSRRSSVASASDVAKVVSEKETSPADAERAGYICDLSLSYVTSSAFWSPSYDLALSTTTSTAMLCFDARLTNLTSETWTNSKVTLSTSQTTFSGLQDAIPTLVPWRVKLAGKWTGKVPDGLVDSKEERAQKVAWQTAQVANYAQKPRSQYFGTNGQQGFGKLSNTGAFGSVQQNQAAFGSLKGPQQPQIQMENSLFGRPNAQPAGGGLFGSMNTQPARASGLFGNSNARPAGGGGLFGATSTGSTANAFGSGFGANTASQDNNNASAATADAPAGNPQPQSFPVLADEENDADTILEPTPELSFEESAFEETGLTATYDLPSLKTLKPSSTASKQRVARISFSNVHFSHTVVAKYKPAAYLKAKLRNTSKLTLLKGPTGLTLDGTFMGRSTLPRCSAGDTFTMSLGIDPAIRVTYPKPEVKRSTTGVFTKGESSVYTRVVTLVNTRATAGKPVNITVLDQVPVSEDEKLRIDILSPRGLGSSAAIAAGVPVKENERDWGKAIASLKKAGEVSWDVVLNAGRGVRLTLEYDVAFPTGDSVVQC